MAQAFIKAKNDCFVTVQSVLICVVLVTLIWFREGAGNYFEDYSQITAWYLLVVMSLQCITLIISQNNC